MIHKYYLSLKFLFHVTQRFFIVLFRRKKAIELIRLDYAKEHIFDTSYVVINYRFRNALWYKIGSHKTLDKTIKIFNIEKIEKELEFVVYGLFQKKTYHLNFRPHLTLENDNFKAQFNNVFDQLKLQNTTALSISTLRLDINEPQIVSHKIKCSIKPIQINTNVYNQTDFI